ncbi:iron-containing alcohol dehydrogenase [uncultured Paraglaciecola sp.]|uniref:iron-containing alcohol dehydrogenase n=1 Tax=uncultured Paraglaciecola sp. TaxID=1765024 RepID=UPI002634D898|nr:iron-containing alcohol dehydrogenase [uncultured Paraglaciecola sp.]
MNLDTFNANWNYPTNIRNGIGRISELAEACKELGMQAPLLVTDPGLADLPMTQHAVKICQQAGLTCAIYSQIKANPTSENVAAGVAAFQQGRHDGVIAFGGGSALDAAKAVALMVGQDRPLWDFEDVGDNWTRVNTQGMAPVVAVPTTSGTGSEVGRASVITDQAQHLKRLIFHPKMLPSIVILDPELTVGLPPKLTAATGMDALSHALEAYCANYYHPMAEGVALEAIRLIKNHLPKAVANGSDLEARAQVMVSSTMGATAFQRGLGGMHALAHSLGALYDSHHGLLNAVLMPYVLKANCSAIEPRIERLARYLELNDSSFDGFLQWILALRAELGIPHSLSEIGIDSLQIEKIGQMAVEDGAAGGNPIELSAQQYSALCLAAIEGEL